MFITIKSTLYLGFCRFVKHIHEISEQSANVKFQLKPNSEANFYPLKSEFPFVSWNCATSPELFFSFFPNWWPVHRENWNDKIFEHRSLFRLFPTIRQHWPRKAFWGILKTRLRKFIPLGRFSTRIFKATKKISLFRSSFRIRRDTVHF